MRRGTLLTAMAGLMAATAVAQQPASTTTAAPQPSPGEIVEAARAEEWIPIASSDLLIMTLAPDAQGPSTRSGERRVIIQLMPAPFSQGWVANIRTLARAHWWDGLAVVRVQDNYVTQWGDPDGEDATRARPLPAGLRVMTEAEYTASPSADELRETLSAAGTSALNGLFNRQGEVRRRGGIGDPYSGFAGAIRGWPVGAEGGRAWPIHCYGMVGVGRGISPDTGSGAELYTVIGHAPRHLDRNIALVGRVVEGMQHLSSLPRGTGPLGFYETPGERTTITSIRLASELPGADQPRFEYLSTESDSFARYAEVRANRRDPFFIQPARGADICNIPVPVRRVRG